MKVKNLKNTSNQDTTKSGLPLFKLARRVVNEESGHTKLTKQDIKNKVGAHTIEKKTKQKGISITSQKNNNSENTSYYGVRYFVPMKKINEMDSKISKKK